MIISHKYRFIFLKTRRTGGSSFEQAVAPYLGQDDIATGSETDGTARQGLDDHPNITAHIPWWEIEQICGFEPFENYYKFCFERNSYDKAFSEWSYKKASHGLQIPDLNTYTDAHPVSDVNRYYHGFGDGQLKFAIYQYHQQTYIPTVKGILALLGIPTSAINGIRLKRTSDLDGPAMLSHDFMTYNKIRRDEKFCNIIADKFSAELKIFGYQ